MSTMSTEPIVVFADVTCPFTHLGLRRLVTERQRRGRDDVRLVVKAWPLELINGMALRGDELAPKVAALREGVAPGLFTGFDPRRFPSTSLPALAAAAAAIALDIDAGERLSLALRTALFEHGLDIGDPSVVEGIAGACGLPGLAPDEDRVAAEWEDGRARGAEGSPHFFVGSQSWFCPALGISKVDGRLVVEPDEVAFRAFADAAFGRAEA